MYNNVKIGLLGGDLRQVALARKLASLGFETAVWGLGACSSEIGSAVRCVDFSDAIRGSVAVILPLPASSDGVRLNCPLSEDNSDLRLTKIMELAGPKSIVLAGKVEKTLKDAAGERGVKLIDYFDNEELQIKNALPTAEGAVEIAMRELPVTIMGSRCAVLGYGRVAKAVAMTLKALGAYVTVAARKKSDLAWAEIERCSAVNIEKFLHETPHAGDGAFDVIFNTVPAPVIDEEALKNISAGTLIIDLAASPGGVNVRAAKETGHKVIWALSLPGKTSPFTAGNIICDTVTGILEKEGVIKPL